MLEMIQQGKLQSQKLFGKTGSLKESIEELRKMNNFAEICVSVIDRF